MRWKALACVVTALAFLIPAAPAAAQLTTPGLDEACQPIERLQYKDLRKLIDIDLDTATDIEVRVRADQVLFEARAESLPRLPDATQAALDGSEDDLRVFLKTGMEKVWFDDLLVLVTQTMTGGGANVKAAASKTLDEGTIEASLAYLNNGLYVAREKDCQESQTSPTPSPTSVSLPKTGPDTSALALAGAVLLAFGIGAVLVARRVRA